MSVNPQVSPALGAALLLLCQQLVPDLNADEAEILAFTGATKDEALEMGHKLRELLSTVERESREASATERVTRAVRGYLWVHPDAVCDVDGCRTYTDDFRDYILCMRDPGEVGETLSIGEVALASGIPLNTIEGWMHSRPDTP